MNFESFGTKEKDFSGELAVGASKAFEVLRDLPEEAQSYRELTRLSNEFLEPKG
mgnify:CR=1 FL=1